MKPRAASNRQKFLRRKGHKMDLLKVKLAEYVANTLIKVTFSNDAILICDLMHLLGSGVFKTLSDPDKFRQFSVNDGVVEWPGEIDIAPEYLYKIGTPIPGTQKPSEPAYVSWSA